MLWSFVQMLFSLAVVLGLMFALLYVVKKYFSHSISSANSGLNIDVLGSKTIQPKKSIHVVRVVDKVLVLGSSENRLSLLAELSARETAKIEKLMSDVRIQSVEIPASFSEYLAKGMKNVFSKRSGDKI